MGFLAFFNSLRFLAIAASCPLRQTPSRFTFRFIDHFSSCDAIAESKSINLLLGRAESAGGLNY